MDQRELEARSKALNKAIAANEPASSLLGLLASLKEVNMTEEMLRATKVGVVVNRLSKNPNKDLARTAVDLVTKWKKAVEAEKVAKMSKIKVGTASPPTGGSSSLPAAAAAPGTYKPFKGNPELRRFDKDGVDTKRTESAVRNGIIGLLYNGLAFRSTEPCEVVLAKAVEVEHAALEAYKGETNEYRQKMRSLFQNLKHKSNRDLGMRVMSGDIKPAHFVRMTHEELKSAEQKEQDSKLERENMKKAQVPMMEKSISDALRCGKCGQKKVSYSQAQTRSADEPMTTFCECTVCGNRWKFS